MTDNDAIASGKVSATEGFLVVASVVLLPIAFFLAHQAPRERLLYPAVNAVLALYLFSRRSPWYFGQCVLTFCFVSLVRRFVDLQAGWNPSNPVLLTPYLCCMVSGIGLIEYWLRRNPRYIGAFLCILLCIAYGLVVAMLDGRVLASLVDAMKWGTGPVFAVYVLSQAEHHREIRKVVETSLIWAGAAMGAYGIAQFILMPPWDAQWMRNAIADLGLDSIGQPSPFAVRVFSTMNSPGSLGIFMTAGIVLALKRSVGVTAIAVPLMLIGLALCQYRSIWAATAVAVWLVVRQRQAQLRTANVLVIVVTLVVALVSIASITRIRETLIQRVSTLSSLSHDESGKVRLAQYSALLRNDNLVLGEGLAINGASRRLDKGAFVAIDGALIEIWRALGVVVGTAFLTALAMLVWVLIYPPTAVDRQVYFDRAIVLSTFIQLPMGSVHAGELSFTAWTFLAFGLAACAAVSARARAFAGNSLPTRLTPFYEHADV